MPAGRFLGISQCQGRSRRGHARQVHRWQNAGATAGLLSERAGIKEILTNWEAFLLFIAVKQWIVALNYGNIIVALNYGNINFTYECVTWTGLGIGSSSLYHLISSGEARRLEPSLWHVSGGGSWHWLGWGWSTHMWTLHVVARLPRRVAVGFPVQAPEEDRERGSGKSCHLLWPTLRSQTVLLPYSLDL